LIPAPPFGVKKKNFVACLIPAFRRLRKEDPKAGLSYLFEEKQPKKNPDP
jgi:hypothetical protein